MTKTAAIDAESTRTRSRQTPEHDGTSLEPTPSACRPSMMPGSCAGATPNPRIEDASPEPVADSRAFRAVSDGSRPRPALRPLTFDRGTPTTELSSATGEGRENESTESIDSEYFSSRASITSACLLNVFDLVGIAPDDDAIPSLIIGERGFDTHPRVHPSWLRIACPVRCGKYSSSPTTAKEIGTDVGLSIDDDTDVSHRLCRQDRYGRFPVEVFHVSEPT